uniref:Uncharacterized protein n=1 Tax=Salix viminalis TaxID=40686 RepID=A0A6N2M1V7_SALVM
MASHDQSVRSEFLYCIADHILCLSTPNHSLHVDLHRDSIIKQTEREGRKQTNLQKEKAWLTSLLKFLKTASARCITLFAKSAPYFSMATITSAENMCATIR